MAKHAQTILQTIRQQPMNCLIVFDHFVGLGLKGLRKIHMLLKMEKMGCFLAQNQLLNFFLFPFMKFCEILPDGRH